MRLRSGATHDVAGCGQRHGTLQRCGVRKARRAGSLGAWRQSMRLYPALLLDAAQQLQQPACVCVHVCGAALRQLVSSTQGVRRGGHSAEA